MPVIGNRDQGDVGIQADTDDIQTQIGVAGAGLTAIPALVSTALGKPQIVNVAVTVAANAASTTIATVTTQAVMIKSVVVRAVAAQTADLTNLVIKGGASSVVTFIDDVTGLRSNLAAADAQVAWTGAVVLPATATIAIDPTGTGDTALNLVVSIEYVSCVAGGYLTV